MSSSELYLVFKPIYSILRTEKKVFTFFTHPGWGESRLPSLARVLLCLVGVGVSQVSWESRYLDKP